MTSAEVLSEKVTIPIRLYSRPVVIGKIIFDACDSGLSGTPILHHYATIK